MGMAQPLIYGDNFQIGGAITQQTITDVASTLNLGSITLPSDMIVKKAYLDLNIRGLNSNSGGAFNWLNANAALKAVKHSGGATYTSITLNSQTFYILGAGFVNGTYIYGTTEIGAAFAAGQQTDITVTNAKALGNNIYLWDVQPVARIIVR
jgi:hypothetical protein